MRPTDGPSTSGDRLDVSGRDAWAALIADAYVPLRIVSDEPDLRGALRERELADLAVSQVASTPVSVARTARSTVTDPRDVFLLCMFVRGAGLSVQDGRLERLSGRDGFLLDGDQPYTLRFGGGNELITLRVPIHYLEPGELALRRLTSRAITGDDIRLNVLRHHLFRLLADRTPLTDDQIDENHEVTLELLHRALQPMIDSEQQTPPLSGAALVASARWFIEEHHAAPQLTIDDVAREYGLSRRYLESQFTRLGAGPAAYLRQARLRHAAQLLTMGRPGGTASIAVEVGFADVNTFVRAFRREYGVTPARWSRLPASRPHSRTYARPSDDLLTDLSPFAPIRPSVVPRGTP